MALTEYTKNTTIIGALGTNPAERGLTTQEFKDKFDQFAKEFVAWFNDTHLPEVDEHLAEDVTEAHGNNVDGELNMQDNLLTRPCLKDYAESTTTDTDASGTVDLDLTAGNVFDITVSGETTFTFSNPPASGRAGSFSLIVRQPSVLQTINFPASVKWNDDKAPEFVTEKTAVLTFVTVDAGSRWYGFNGGTKFTT
jgi:hypothetical protein